MKEIFNGLKLLWKDERGNGIIRLGIGIIFMIILVSLAKTSYNNIPVKKDNIEKSSSYKALVKVNKMEYELNYINKDKIIFTNDETSCKVIEQELTCGGDHTFIVNFWNIDNSLVYNLYHNYDNLYITNYNNGNKESVYEIALSDFIKELDKENVITEGTIKYTILEEKLDGNYSITKIDLDLSNYYEYKTGIIDDYNINIEYLRG